MNMMNSRPHLQRELGRTEFTVREMAERTGLSVEAARGRLARYVAADLVERTPYVQQYVDEAGRPTRGRPAHLYRVR
jgi:predicted ArsR family transcriptional regulator